GDRRRADRLATRGPQAARRGRPDRHLHPPSALRSLPAVGLVYEGRRPRDRSAAALEERHRFLRPHPPGAPLHDRADCPPRGEVAHLPAAAAGFAAEARAGALGRRSSWPRPRLPRRRRCRRRALLAADRTLNGRPGRAGCGEGRLMVSLLLAAAILVPNDGAQVIQVTAKKFEFSPAVIELR